MHFVAREIVDIKSLTPTSQGALFETMKSMPLHFRRVITA